MGGFMGMKLKDSDPMMQQVQRLLQGELSPLSETLSEEELQGQQMQRLFMTQEEKTQALAAEWAELGPRLAERKTQWEQEQFRYQQKELSKNKNDKTLAKLKTPEEIEELREKRHQEAVSADKRKVFADKARHGFYKFVGAFVKAGRHFTKGRREEKNTAENPTYEVAGLQAAYERLYGLRPDEADPDFEAKMAEFEEKYGAAFREIEPQYQEKARAAEEAAKAKVAEAEQLLGKELTEEERSEAIQKERKRILDGATYTMHFGDSVQSHVEGGTKPNAFQYASDGSRWLMKTNHSCIGAAAPNASIMTVAGYQVQKLVDPATAIEAFESKSKGVGTVSLQRMVDGVVSRKDPEYVDFFRFSRTPEAMEPEELEKIEKLAPQFLREYMTDFLLGNYDTKGENFLLCRDGEGKLVIRGIDKEAAGRKDLVPEAQHMQKDKHFFDQDTVYNQLFRKFADGSMRFDLQDAAQYIERIEQMSTEDYLKIYQPYFEQQARDNPDRLEEIKKNVTYRKEFIRVEARRFFGELVQERMKNVSEAEAAALRQKYLGGVDGGIFLFRNETAEDLRAEREKIARQKETDAAALEEKVKQADKEDEKRYNRRHAMYDFAKAIIMGTKRKPGADYEEKRTTRIKMSEQQFDTTGLEPEMALQVQARKERFERTKKAVEDKRFGLHREQLIERYMQRNADGFAGEISQEELRKFVKETFGAEIEETARKWAKEETEYYYQEQTTELRMVADQEIFLGGTKPMSQYIGADGSKWLAKQAVTCVGTTKLSGAYLTEIGANIQKIVDEGTAVEAFVGQTRKHGVVSFQRRLKNVVSSKRLDLFKFSRHPELATQATTRQVEELMPQILREHVTDWLLCNFDTKGENFILTQEEGQPMVLHGIDKEAAFNKILDPKAQQMSTTYKPHANNTLYNVVFEKFASGEMDFDLNAVIPYVEKVMAMSDEEYMSQYQRYLDYLTEKAGTKGKELEKVEQIKANMLARKTGLRDEYIRFFTELIERRCKSLHPDEAAALRQKYYGPGGTAFRFPAAQV